MNSSPRFTFVILLFLAYSTYNACHAQVLSKEEVALTISKINDQLNALYVFPEVAKEMGALLNENMRSGVYGSFNDLDALAHQLTADLQSISHDKHLRVLVRDPVGESSQLNTAVSSEAGQNKYGFKTVKMLEGRVGYIDLREFMEAAYAGGAAHRAMKRLANTDAMIIDLRNNPGGSPTMIQLLSSYFFGAEPVHLNSFYWRPTNATTETWTLSTLPGKRMPDIDLYILTSNRTFSAAEEFTYNMQNLNRATIIGEKTGGGAHPGGIVTVTKKLDIWIPQGRAINPITKTNWEGNGVIPDIKVSEDQALLVAHISALEKLKATSTNSALLNSLEYSIQSLKNSLTLEKSKYADLLVDAKYVPWNEEIDTFYGRNSLYSIDSTLIPIDPKAVLGNNYYYVTLPKGSYLTLRFTDNFVVDTPDQPDLYLDEVGKSGDRAAVYISEDGIDYVQLGIASGGKTNALDLADISYKGIVNYVKIVGLDLNGASPGFDIIRVYGLPFSNVDKYVSKVEIDDYLKDPNTYQRRIHLEPIEFEFDSYDLQEEGKAYLDELMEVLSEYPELRFKIVGHTDNIGTEEFNVGLSKKRAFSVFNYLIENGLNRDKLTFDGRGTREPLATNDSEKGRMKNRRVELIKVD